ncbi:FBD protein [Medicago truncatula]|uniref:FBD protein n=2 Tax=Medicago truncatula TaxID=3880 RepID=A0A072VJ39_MEDTR|nr:FBD protein [Medicago truncatula]
MKALSESESLCIDAYWFHIQDFVYKDSNGLPLLKNDEENWEQPEFVPECSLSCLRTCTIGDFSGLPIELGLAKYILKNSRTLEIMVIWSKRERAEIERKLFLCLKASATCELLVYR